MEARRTLQPFESHGRDLYAKLRCTCPNKLFIGKDIEHLMKHDVRLVGYADDNFFDRVNAAPQERACKCGRRYTVQWFRDGVDARFIDPPVQPAVQP